MALVADAVIFTTSGPLSKQLAEILKMKQVINIVQADSADTASDAASRFPKALLIIDWSVGAEDAVKVLVAQSRKPEAIERPIMVIAETVESSLVATAAEYGVGQIYAEAIDRKLLSSRIGSLLIANSQSAPYKKTLTKVKKLREAGKWNETVEPLKALLTANPKDWNAKAELATTLLEMGHIEEAKKALTGVESTSPRFLRGVHILGRTQMLAGDFAGALATLESAHALNPNDPDRLVDIGSALLELDRVGEAKDFFDNALVIEPDLKNALVGKGKCLLIEENVNDALAILKGVTSSRELASIFNMSAVMTMRAGRHESGLKLYMAAIKALGKNQKIHARLLFNMGVGYRRWQRLDKALQCFKKSLEYDPSYSRAKDQVATVMAQSVAVPGEAVPDSLPPSAKPPQKPGPEAATAKSPDIVPSGGLLAFDSDFDDIDDDDDMEEGIVYK